MRLLTVGGGSGGHVTPVLAVINEIKRGSGGEAEIRFWSDRRFAHQAQQIITSQHGDIKTRAIFSGKFRRYHRTSLWKQLLDVPTILKNIGDSILLVVGFFQSLGLLIAWRPDVIFTKGGFVCLPVGVAAHILRIPFIIHDSDAHPGLTNRILAPWATQIATGAPLEHYSYPVAKTTYTGIPLSSDFKEFSKLDQQKNKKSLGLPKDRPLVVVTGGGLGAERINKATIEIAKPLLKSASVVHITGVKHLEKFEALAPSDKNYKLLPFVSQGMAQLLGAADIVVTRAGATTMLELAALKKAVVIIPNEILTGGHQIKNAQVYESREAAIIIDERQLQDNPGELLETILRLIKDNKLRHRLGQKLGKFAKPNASRDIVSLIEKVLNREVKQK